MKTVNFEMAGKPHSMVIPDDYLSELCASDIITGKSYPFPEWLSTQWHQPNVVVDIGGHAGEFSVLARIMWPKAQIHCYEPNPQLLPYLQQNCLQYDFITHSYAVGPAAAKLPLFISGYGSVANSLVERPNQTGKSIEVLVCPMSKVMQLKPDVLKIDAEGFEMPLLYNARTHDDASQPAEWSLKDVELMYIEFHSEQDRIAMEKLLLPTHSLYHARIGHKDQGEVMYVRRHGKAQL